MNLKIAKERILIIQDEISLEQAEIKAREKKIDAFGAINKLAGIFSKFNDSDFVITYREHRYQPFWHIASKANYIYDRNSHYQFDVKNSEVKTVTVEGKNYEIANGHLHIPVLEHCKQSLTDEVLMDGLNGNKDKELKNYISKNVLVTDSKKLNTIAGKESVIVPPQTRVSGIIREMLSQMIKGIQADKIFEEDIEITCIDLYYRPVYAFQFEWKSKNKQAILEVDAVTGNTSTGTRTFNEFAGKILDRDFIFDISADVAGMFIPGGSIAVKAAKKIIDSSTR